MSVVLNIFQWLFSKNSQNEQEEKPKELTHDEISDLTTIPISDSNNNDDCYISKTIEIEWSIKRVLEPTLMLSDNEIFAALKLLKRQFETNIRKGFYDPQSMNVKRTKKFDFRVKFPQRFLQIIHNGELHWLTLTNFNSVNANQIHVYDSLPIESTYIDNGALKNCLRKILKSPDEAVDSLSIECCVEPVQKQPDAKICGLFAIAFALDLCLDVNPASQVYDTTRMRSHLFECLKQNFLREFPKTTNMACEKTIQSPAIIFIDI